MNKNMNIKYIISEGKHCLSCDAISVADFGDTLEEAKKNFKKACNMMIDFRLDGISTKNETESKQ